MCHLLGPKAPINLDIKNINNELNLHFHKFSFHFISLPHKIHFSVPNTVPNNVKLLTENLHVNSGAMALMLVYFLIFIFCKSVGLGVCMRASVIKKCLCFFSFIVANSFSLFHSLSPMSLLPYNVFTQFSARSVPSHWQPTRSCWQDAPKRAGMHFFIVAMVLN